ncbi:cell division protein FtsQ/DivIB [Blattabacterium cuenoti]|uniref:cell division protein FtsQ/DivIB n=1 Tax=Blattabacterium cuenoti TaxID=1653831 RepID=UPI001EEA6ABC|nr:cell division protein FtsQ [Blattabacterium cuenoti]
MHRNRKIKKLHIIIMNTAYNKHFLDEKMIKNILFNKNKYKNIDNKIGEICVLEMENKLNNYPFIKKSEVFISVDGTININILQKEPILRIKNGKKEFYLTKDSEELEIYPFYSSNVILAKGPFSKEEKKYLLELVEFINYDNLLKNQIISIKKKEDNSFILIPKIGNHYIMLGNMKDFKDKLYKLKSFYKQYLNKISLDQYKIVDLQYKNQIVAKKR